MFLVLQLGLCPIVKCENILTMRWLNIKELTITTILSAFLIVLNLCAIITTVRSFIAFSRAFWIRLSLSRSYIKG